LAFELTFLAKSDIFPLMNNLLLTYSPCNLCPRQCNVDRSVKKGFCRSGLLPGVASHNIHRGEEPFISGTRGSGTIFFHHCTLSCLFCQNFPISQLHEFPEVTATQLSDIYLELQERGVHNINWVTPTHFLPSLVEALGLARKKGLSIPVVYNSSGYERPSIVKALEEHVDIWLPDMKYAFDALAEEFSNAKGYVETNRASVKEMLRMSGLLQLDDDGIAKKGVVVRHLVLPGQMENSRQVLQYIADELSKDLTISIMSQYFPAWKANAHETLNRNLTHEEYDSIVDYALGLGLENALIQDMDAEGGA